VAHRGRVAEQVKAFLGEGEEDVVFAGEITVDGGRAVLDPLGNLANRDVLEPLGDEQLARGVENSPSHRLAVAFLSFLDTHRSSPDFQLGYARG
jgi:hypothetical protein